MAAPTFVNAHATAFDSTTSPKTTASFNTLANDLLVTLGGTSHSPTTMATPTNTQGAMTQTLQESLIVTDYCPVYAWSASDGTARTGMTVSATASGGDPFGFNVLQFRDSDGIGANASTSLASGAASLTFTTTQDNSAIAMIVLDWSTIDGAGRVYRQVNGAGPVELTYFRATGFYAGYVAYYADAGVAGSKTIGLTTPSTQKYTIIGVEVKGNAGPPPPPPPVEHIGTGTPIAGTTSITTAAYPTGWAAGDKIICSVASNHTTEATEPTVAGFTKLGTLNGGGGAQGVGTGNRRLTFFERDAQAGDDTTPTVSLATGNVMIACLSAFRTAGTWETTTVAFGAETTAGTAWSEVATSDPDFLVDDMALVGYAVRDTTAFSAMGISASGATFDSVTEQAELSSETGNDISLAVGTATVTAGDSTAAPTITATISTSETGVVGVVRLRATVAASEGAASGGYAFAGSATGARVSSGSASGAFAFAGSATGKKVLSGSAAGGYTFSGSATGREPDKGAATGGYGFTGSATGQHVSRGSASGGYAYAGSATGVEPSGGFGVPTGLTATPVSPTQIDLSWNSVVDATGYDIERDGVVIVFDHPITTYSDTTLSEGTEYDYRVRAVAA